MLYSVALCAQISSCCRVDVADYMCKTGEVVSSLDKATMGARCLYWEALKVDFALETLDFCMWTERVRGHDAAGQRGRRAQTDSSNHLVCVLHLMRTRWGTESEMDTQTFCWVFRAWEGNRFASVHLICFKRISKGLTQPGEQAVRFGRVFNRKSSSDWLNLSWHICWRK